MITVTIARKRTSIGYLDGLGSQHLGRPGGARPAEREANRNPLEEGDTRVGRKNIATLLRIQIAGALKQQEG